MRGRGSTHSRECQRTKNYPSSPMTELDITRYICVGKTLTLRVNNHLVHNRHALPQLADEGLIGFQLRMRIPTEVSLKNVRIRSLP